MEVVEILPPPIVTQEEFDKLQCNRCGQCCEQFYLPSPFELLRGMAKDWEWIHYWNLGGEDAIEVREDTVKHFDWLSHVAPLEGQEPPALFGDRVMMECDRLKYEPDGKATCTAYDKRPYACSGFPYDKPQPGFPTCVWNVVISDG